jgi:hypothetical protein
LIQWADLVLLNKLQEKKRVRNGKPAKMVDRSMEDHYHGAGGDEEDMQEEMGNNGLLDVTDRNNDEFVYIY